MLSGLLSPVVQVRIGGYELDGGNYELRQGIWALVHPQYGGPNGIFDGSDAALVLLDKPSTRRPLMKLPQGALFMGGRRWALPHAKNWASTASSKSSGYARVLVVQASLVTRLQVERRCTQSVGACAAMGPSPLC